MKKLIAAVALLALTGCGCMNSPEPEVKETKVVYRSYQPAPRSDCDYVEGNTCYHYIRAPRVYTPPRPVVRYVRPRPVYTYVEPEPAPMPAPQPVVVNNCNGCAPSVRATREPVEVVYKKTTYRTTYEPKTTSSVSYEKEPYSGQVSLPAAAPSTATVVTTEPVVQPSVQETSAMTLDEIK